ncbi:MAG: fused MFS/spermidine synthase [Gammaproteobacteria bacterium]|nr:fused MFS/spermidine synthase [Gammaproteobacteria bacterium]
MFERTAAPSQFTTNALILFIILTEGFVSIAVEMITIRQLLPVAGGSVIVTSLIIGIFLLFLALGYAQGGAYSGDARSLLRRNFLLAAFWLGIGLSYVFINYFFNFLEGVLGQHIFYPVILYLLVIIAPLIFVLGQTIPIVLNGLQTEKTAGRIGGQALALNTIGSFLGSIGTTVIFFHYFGIGFTIFINATLLLGLNLLLTRDKDFVLTLLFAVSVSVFLFILNVSKESARFTLTNNYANYEVLKLQQNSQEKILVINSGLSAYTNDHGQGFPYIEMIKKILFRDLKLSNKAILVLGAGGFSLSAENTFGNNFTYVDIDQQLLKVVVPHFRTEIKENLMIDDARHYLRIHQQLFDAIVTDVYSDVKAIPAQFLTREYMHSVHHHLTKQGIAIFNIIANPFLTDAYSKRIDNTIRSVFANCMVIPHTYADRPTNIIYSCKKADHPDPIVYTDDLNRSTTDAFSW